MSSDGWTVGQEVILRDRSYQGYRDTAATISRVGRMYVYIERYGREAPFYIDNGFEKVEFGNGGRIFTPDGLAEHERRVVAEKRLLDVMRGSWIRRLSVDDIERILTILAPDGLQ